MEIKTIRQVSHDYGISRQMLYYYEEIGLIKSSRKDDYAYRVYNEEAIKRLQQIIILRKLQIPMRQIKDILNNQNAVAVIDVFEQNISELEKNITALSTVKSILTRFVNEMKEKADIQLKFDLLNDKTMLAVVNSLSFSENKIKEKILMEELNKASKSLNKLTDTKVRVMYLLPMTVAFADHVKSDPESYKPFLKYLNPNTELIVDPRQKDLIDMKAVIKKFIDDVDLFKIKPDARVFGFNAEGDGVGVHQIWVSIPDDFDVPAPLKKISFHGGLYAACTYDGDLTGWLENNGEYEWAPEGGINRPIMEELINPFNRHGLRNPHSEETGFMYADILWPIREIEKLSEELIKTLAELEESVVIGKSTKIDLSSMEKQGDFELSYTNRFMKIKSDSEEKPTPDVRMATTQQFKCPLKIELRVKTDNANIDINYANGGIKLNHDVVPAMRGKLLVFDITDTSFHNYKSEDIPANKFVDIEWILGKNEMAVKINGQLRHLGSDYGYVNEFKVNPDFNVSSPVFISTARGSTVTVEKLRITEL